MPLNLLMMPFKTGINMRRGRKGSRLIRKLLGKCDTLKAASQMAKSDIFNFMMIFRIECQL